MSACPTADDVAIAIVAACRETGESPVDCASRAPELRARKYTMLALAEVFPPKTDEDKRRLCRLAGCPGPGLYLLDERPARP